MSKAILEEYLEAWNSGNASNVMSFFDDSVSYEDVALGKKLNRTELVEFVESALKRSPDLSFDLVSVCEGGNLMSWEWIMHRTKDGVKSSTPGQSMTEFRGGKIVMNRDYWSTLPTPTQN